MEVRIKSLQKIVRWNIRVWIDARKNEAKSNNNHDTVIMWLDEYDRISKLRISWNFFGKRDENVNWANHLKDHLTKTILSDDKLTIVKSLEDKKMKKKKEELIKAMESRNQKTLES